MNSKLNLIITLLQSSDSIFPRFIIGILILIVIFLILREINMWYWKINERISLQEEANELQKENIQLMNSIITSLNIQKPKTDQDIIEDELNKLKTEELEEIVKNYEVNSKEDVFTSLDILKERKKSYEGMRDKIIEFFK